MIRVNNHLSSKYGADGHRHADHGGITECTQALHHQLGAHKTVKVLQNKYISFIKP